MMNWISLGKSIFGIWLGLLAGSAAAQTVQVIDGDTIKMGDTVYRLHGIDAPEMPQMCGNWAAGRDAAMRLRWFVGDKMVTCERRGTDHYWRTVAVCRANGEDLGALMVSAGMAWALTKESLDYVSQEATARAAGLGVHSGGCQPAWTWRAEHR
jgi:endonuclease YncB( thermonuclease family)